MIEPDEVFAYYINKWSNYQKSPLKRCRALLLKFIKKLKETTGDCSYKMRILYITAQAPYGKGETFINEEMLAIKDKAELFISPRNPAREVFHKEARSTYRLYDMVTFNKFKNVS